MAGVNDLVFEERVKIMLGNMDLAVGMAIPGRGDAAALAGLLSIDADGDFLIGDRSIIWNTITTDDPYEAVISLNIYRRHLTPDDTQRLIDDVLKAKPNLSNRQIGKLTRVDHHKVADRRRKLESTFPQLRKGSAPMARRASGRQSERRMKRHYAAHPKAQSSARTQPRSGQPSHRQAMLRISSS
jgi:hypothetical protein